MTDLVLDANALSDLASGHRGLVALTEAAQQADGIVSVPTICLVEALTGSPRDASTNQTLKGLLTTGLSAGLARIAAQLRAAVNGDDAADPVIVATAQQLGATVVSADPDVARLATHTNPQVRVVDQHDL